MRFLYIILSISTLFACNNVKKVNQNGATDSIISNSTNSNGKYRFIVSFISIGSGIDLKSKQMLNEFITNYEQSNNVKITFNSTNWGKEGEVDYCFLLLELNSKKQEKFIAEAKDILKNCLLVRYKENDSCHTK